MNIFNKVTLQSLKKNRTRTAVTIIGVILSVAMLTAVTNFIVSLQAFLVRDTIAHAGDWHVKFMNVDAAFAQKISAARDVKSTAAIQNIGYARLPGSLNPAKPYLFVVGFNDEAMKAMSVRLASGRLPQNSTEIVISEQTESNGGVVHRIGDKLTLSIGKRIFDGMEVGQETSYGATAIDDAHSGEVFRPVAEAAYTVVGICKRPGFEGYAAPGYTAITKAEASAAADMDLLVTMKSPGKVYDFAKKAAGNSGYEFNSALLRYYGVSANDKFSAVLYGLGGILIAIIMIGGILLIYNSFAISVSERARQFGVLSSVGATRKQLRKSVLFEGVCIGAAGIPLGVLAGVGGIGVTLHFVGNLFASMVVNSAADVRLSLRVSAPALAIAALLGLSTILISAYLPARRAMKKSAVEIIRQTDDVKIKAKAVKTSKLVSGLFGLEGTLAMKNFKRDKKRYRSTVISLFVSLVLFISASAFGMYLRQSADMTVQDFGYDISFSPSQSSRRLEDAQLLRLYGQLKHASGVYSSAYQNSITCYAPVETSAFTSRFLQFYGEIDSASDSINYAFGVHFIDDEVYRSYLDALGLSRSEYGIAQGKLPAIARVEGYDGDSQRTVSFDVFNKSACTFDVGVGYKPGMNDIPSRKITAAISDIVPPGTSGKQFSGLTFFAPYSDISLLGSPADAFNGMELTFRSHDPMKSAAEMEVMIQEADAKAGYTLFNTAEAMAQNRNILMIINVFTYGFVALISLITIANVFNTISTGINLRKREFAMLRSVGMGNRSFNRMMNFECIFYGLKALLYGLPVSFAVTYLIYKALGNGVDVAFTLPWSSIAVSVCSVFFVVFVTMIYATRQIKKSNVIDALRALV